MRDQFFGLWDQMQELGLPRCWADDSDERILEQLTRAVIELARNQREIMELMTKAHRQTEKVLDIYGERKGRDL